MLLEELNTLHIGVFQFCWSSQGNSATRHCERPSRRAHIRSRAPAFKSLVITTLPCLDVPCTSNYHRHSPLNSSHLAKLTTPVYSPLTRASGKRVFSLKSVPKFAKIDRVRDFVDSVWTRIQLIREG